MTLEKENGPAKLSGRDVIVRGTRNANRQRKGSLRAQRTLSAVGKILPASEMAGPKTFRRGTLTRVEMWIAVMGVTVASPREFPRVLYNVGQIFLRNSAGVLLMIVVDDVPRAMVRYSLL